MSLTEGKILKYLRKSGKKIKGIIRSNFKSFHWYPDPRKRGTWGFISDCINVMLLVYMIYLMHGVWRPDIDKCILDVEKYYGELSMNQNFYPGWKANETNETSLFQINDFENNNCRWVCNGGDVDVGHND